MTDPVIPPEAVEAATRSFRAELFEEDSLLHPILAHSAQWEARHKMRAALAAALPHLRPLVEARWALLYSDAVDNGNELAQELRQDLKVATQVGLELGRQEAAEEIAQRFLADARQHEDDRGNYQIAQHYAHIAREVATRTADARTDPSGHTDLPPTPDAAGSNRLPEETGKGGS